MAYTIDLFYDTTVQNPSQLHKAKLLFQRHPPLEQACLLAQKLGHIYRWVKDKAVAFTKLAHWYDQIEKNNAHSFNTITNIIKPSLISLKEVPMLQKNLSTLKLEH